MTCVYRSVMGFLLEWQPCQINIRLSVSTYSLISPQKVKHIPVHFYATSPGWSCSDTVNFIFNSCSWNRFQAKTQKSPRKIHFPRYESKSVLALFGAWGVFSPQHLQPFTWLITVVSCVKNDLKITSYIPFIYMHKFMGTGSSWRTPLISFQRSGC